MREIFGVSGFLAVWVGCSVGAAEPSSSVRPPGVTPEVERAIVRGLNFLAKSQKRNGSFGKGSYEAVDRQTYPTAISSLAGLAFLASGSTATRGPYAGSVERVTRYLVRYCTPSSTRVRGYRVPGLLYNPDAMEERPMYCHALAMMYLALIFPQETDAARRETIRDVLHRAIELTERTQSDDGGWGYRADFREDEGTLAVTQAQALRACRDAGISVPKTIIDRTVEFIARSTNPDGTVRYRVSSHRSNSRPGVTCAGVVALWQAGRYDDPLLKRISDYVNRSIAPVYASWHWQKAHHSEYVLYFLAQSQYVLGGPNWKRFYSRVSKMLLREQGSDGSWEGRDGGDIYGTSIALIVLQLPYNRLPVYQR